jgi:hypothetical protein
MFWRTHEHRALLPALCGLVFLALWNNAILWTFCPHLSAKSHHCLTEETSSPSQIDADSQTMSHEHPVLADTITESQESCSYCMMYSESRIDSPSTSVVLNNSAAHGIVAAASGIVWASFASARSSVDVHDHGPPGQNSSRYILNSSFRI